MCSLRRDSLVKSIDHPCDPHVEAYVIEDARRASLDNRHLIGTSVSFCTPVSDAGEYTKATRYCATADMRRDANSSLSTY